MRDSSRKVEPASTLKSRARTKKSPSFANVKENINFSASIATFIQLGLGLVASALSSNDSNVSDDLCSNIDLGSNIQDDLSFNLGLNISDDLCSNISDSLCSLSDE